MKFKIDENLPIEVAATLAKAGHDAMTVNQQLLGGEIDPNLFSVCCREQRIMITLDVGFSNIRKYPPAESAGVIVLRLARQDKSHVLNVVNSFIDRLRDENLQHQLWIVEETSIRIR